MSMQNPSVAMQGPQTEIQPNELAIPTLSTEPTQTTMMKKETQAAISTVTITPEEISKLDLPGVRGIILKMISTGDLHAILEEARQKGEMKKIGPPTKTDVITLLSKSPQPGLQLQLETLLQLIQRENALNAETETETKSDRKNYVPSPELQSIRTDILTMINIGPLTPIITKAKQDGEIRNGVPTQNELLVLTSKITDPLLKEELATLIGLIQEEEALSKAELASL